MSRLELLVLHSTQDWFRETLNFLHQKQYYHWELYRTENTIKPATTADIQ